jgi:hypothetical protein
MEKKINLKFPFRLFNSDHNIELQSIAYSLNFFLPTLILIISSFFNNYNLTAELGILIGINIIFTQIFSANARSIIVSKKLINLVYSHIFFRIIISIIIITINIFILNLFDFYNKFSLLLISFMIVLQWLNELVLTYLELKKKVKSLYCYIVAALTFVFFIFIDFLYFYNLVYIFLIYGILLFIFFFIFFIKISIRKKNKIFLKNILISLLKSKAFYSSFSISFANLIWRLLIIYYCGKILAGVYFASFAIGSLPGTLFNNTFGPTIIKHNVKVNKNFYYFKYLFIIGLFFLLFWSFLNRDQIFISLSHTQVFGTFISLLGSYFMTKGLYIRQYFIQKTLHQEHIFKVDVFYSLLVIFVVPGLFFFGGNSLIIISFLVSSVLSFLVYNYTFNKMILNK